MFFKSCAALALATGFAAAKPIAKPITARTPQLNAFGGVGNNGQGFSFIDGFNNFNNQQQIIQIQEENLQIIDNGFQQQIVQQVNEVLIIDNQQNGFNNQLNNLFRKSNFNNQFQQQSTVMLVVQEIVVAIDDGFGNQFQSNIFAQSAVVANRGFPATQTVMIFQQETLIASNVINNVGGFQNFQNNFLGQAVNDVNIPTQTNNVQLFGSKPTWSSVAEDPAATLGGIWQAELEDAQKVENNEGDNELNNQAAAQEKQALEEAKAAEEAAAAAEEAENVEEENVEEENVDGEENVEEENVEEEQAVQEGEEVAQQQQARKL